MLEMVQDQYVSKVAPYTHPKWNLKRFSDHMFDEEDFDTDDDVSKKSNKSDDSGNSTENY